MHTEIMSRKCKTSLLEANDKLPKTSQQGAAAKLGLPQASLYSKLT